MSALDSRLLVAHVVYRLDVGGLENGVVNLVNRLSPERFRHAIVALTAVTDFRHRITRDDVRYISLHKSPGHGMRQWPALVRTFRELRPDIVHTRNLAPLEAVLPAWLAGVPARVHGEHGWDVGDLDGSNARHRFTRRFYRPFVTRYVALSRHIQDYLQSSIGVPADAIAQIYNGVDTERYSRTVGTRAPIIGSPFHESSDWLIGTVGRLAAVKDQAGLIRAAASACSASAEARERLRLVIVGDGPLMGELTGGRPRRRRDRPHVVRGIARRCGAGARWTRCLCAAVAGGRHLEHTAGSDGDGVAGYRHAGGGKHRTRDA